MTIETTITIARVFRRAQSLTMPTRSRARSGAKIESTRAANGIANQIVL